MSASCGRRVARLHPPTIADLATETTPTMSGAPALGFGPRCAPRLPLCTYIALATRSLPSATCATSCALDVCVPEGIALPTGEVLGGARWQWKLQSGGTVGRATAVVAMRLGDGGLHIALASPGPVSIHMENTQSLSTMSGHLWLIYGKRTIIF